MHMNSKIKLLLSCFLLALVVVVIQSCGDDDESKPKPSASFTASATTVDAGEEITFTNTSTKATSYVWSFGDGTTSTAESPSKTYANAGSFEVTLIASNSEGSDQASQTITVEEADLGEIYFIDPNDEVINKFSVGNPSDMTTFLEVVGMAGVGLAFDATNERIYFSDFNEYEVGKVWRVNLAGTGLDDIATDLYEPYGVAVDAAGGKIYYADDVDGDVIGHIYQANLDGSGATPIITMADAYFRAVALDLVNDKLYFYDVEADDELGDLWRSNLDGSGAAIVVPDVYGYSIAVDTENGKIYFDDQNSEELKIANLDGSNVQTVDTGGSRIYGIAIDNDLDVLYWSARDDGAIYKADLDGSNRVALRDDLSSPRGIFLKK